MATAPPVRGRRDERPYRLRAVAGRMTVAESWEGVMRMPGIQASQAGRRFRHPAGTVVPVWIDAAGQSQPPPVTATQVAVRVVLAAIATPAAVALVLWLAWRGLRWRLDRNRLARWARAWSRVEPLWTR